ncbi:MAG: hypothetical protein NC543_07395 [bacterium]|nr:hypothetical protein [bacterium]MCM1375399.1 hypothetical protein [Muribaculum sp.]
MRKILYALSVLLLFMGLCACSGESGAGGAKLYIEPAQLTEEEQQLAELLGANTGQRIFDFALDDTVQSIQINSYRLIDGNWELEMGGGGQIFSDKHGRIALDFDRLSEGLRVALQSERHGGSTSYEREVDDAFTDMGYATSVLSARTEITYEKEIPLVLQIVTAKDRVISYSADYFDHPEELEKLDYEGVYALTVRFSQSSVSNSYE